MRGNRAIWSERGRVRRPERMCTMGARVAIAVLAAGRSTRMGDFNKLLAVFGGTPLVRLSVQRATASGAYKVIVVTGHMEIEI